MTSTAKKTVQGKVRVVKNSKLKKIEHNLSLLLEDLDQKYPDNIMSPVISVAKSKRPLVIEPIVVSKRRTSPVTSSHQPSAKVSEFADQRELRI
jgi:hypothetical protein